MADKIKVQVVSILVDSNGSTVGAEFLIGNVKKLLRTNEIAVLYKNGLRAENAVIDSNGYVRAKSGNLKKIIFDKKDNNDNIVLETINTYKSDALNVSIMCEDEVVLRFNFDKVFFSVENEELLPYSLKGRIKNLNIEENSIIDSVAAVNAISIRNYNVIVSWLANRVLLLSRKNAKWLYNLISAEQTDDPIYRAKIALICRAVSIADNYWVKLEGDNVKWKDMNIRHNKLNEVVAQVALHGKSFTLNGYIHSPEYTTGGSYAKAWRRYPDGILWLHKAGHNGSWESKIEAMCSRLLDKMNVAHCYYKMTKDEDLDVCACPAMTNDTISIVDGIQMSIYCNVNNINYDLWLAETDSNRLYKMWIVDYLICNRDRHGQNYGFYYDAKTMKIIGMHPLFDHNNAFDTEFMLDREAHYQFGSMNIRETAKYAMKRVDFHFEMNFDKSDFLTERQYKEFMWRAKDLKVQTVYNPVWVRYCQKKNIEIEQSMEEFNRLHDKYALVDSSQFYSLVERDYLRDYL